MMAFLSVLKRADALRAGLDEKNFSAEPLWRVENPYFCHPLTREIPP